MTSLRRSVRSTKRTAGILTGLIGLCVTGLLVNWWLLVGDEPVVTIPRSALPSPNAYDFYVAAGKAMVHSKQIADTTMRNPSLGSQTAEQERALQQVEADVQQNASALQILHQGFAYEFRTPPTAPFTFAPSPPSAGFRNLARLLFAQSRVRMARGDWGGATESALDAIQLGEDSQRGGALIAHLVGGACLSLGQRPMWETVGHLNAPQSRAATLRLQALMDKHFSYADTMQEEKWVGQTALKQFFHSVNMRNALSTANSFTPKDASTGQRVQTALYLLYGKRRVIHNYTTYMDQTSQLARQSYGLHLAPPPVPTDPINRELLPIFSEARLKDVECQTQNGFLLVMLALHAFRLENGHYPNALTELTPGYLKKVPDDPFAAQGTFQYHIRGERYTLYSIGQDARDNGGTPINDPKYVGAVGAKQRYHITESTRGDIVAGINFP